MTFDDILEQVVTLLQRQGRASYRALKMRFQELDDHYLDVLREEILYVHPVIDDEGRGLVWTDARAASEQTDRPWGESEGRFQAVLHAVMLVLQRDRRVAYRSLQHLFSIDDTLLAEIREELAFRRLACDEDGKGLTWLGDPPPSLQPGETTAAISPASSTPLPLRSAPEAERRQLTVMFCDLVGSTDLSTHLDPEDLRAVVRAYQETAAQVIERYEGHVAQYLGDGLLIYFGYPVAHEDDAQRAVHTGLGVIEAMETLNTRLEADYGVKLAIRIGIHTGPVVVGEMGGGERHENLALGETPNIAARLESIAPSNAVVISPVTAQLAQPSFVLTDLGPHELKGVAEPMQVFRVECPSGADRDVTENLPDGGVFLVGREEEIGLLLRRWEQTKEGLGQVVFLSGEAGIGKSSLVGSLRTHVRQAGCTRIAFRCSPYHRHSALHPIIEHLQRALGWRQSDAPETKLSKLEQGLQGSSLAMAEAVPLMAALLSTPLPEDRYPPLALPPQQQRQQTEDVLVAWLLEQADHQPVLVVWEDLHWADPSTLQVLGLLIDQAPTAAMLHVLTFRPEFVPPWPTRSHMTPITLNRLERLQVEALIANLAQGKNLPPAVVEYILAKTDGVPLFAEELTKMLLASTLLQEEADHYTLTGSLSDVAIPTTLHDSLMARLDQLPEAKAVAQLGAVLGREFSYRMLHALSSLDDTMLHEGLAQLLAAELLYQRGRPPQARYFFKHALIQDAAYESLLRSTRQQAHRHIAQLLEAQFPETVAAEPELVAHHYTSAGQGAEAIPYWQRAGERALAAYAHEEAMSHFQRGLELKAGQPLDAETATLHFGLGRAQTAILPGHRIREAVASLSRAFDYYIEAGDVERAVAVAGYPITTLAGQPTGMTSLITRALTLVPPDSHAAGRLLSRYVKVLGTEHGEYDEAQTAITQALAIAQREGDLALELRTLIDAANVDMSHRRWPACVAKSLRAVELARQAEDPYAEVAARFWGAQSLIYMGEPREAQRHGAAMLALAEKLRDRWWLASALASNAAAAQMQGDWRSAQAFIDRGLAVAPMDPRLLSLRIILAYEMGDVREGETYLEQLIDTLHHTEAGPSVTFGLSALVIPLIARITGEVDRLDVAKAAANTILSSPSAGPTVAAFAKCGLGLLAMLQRDATLAAEHAAALIEDRGAVFALGLGAVDRLLGLLAQTMGDLDRALPHFEEALAFCLKAGYQSERAWTCCDYAGALLQRDDPGDRTKAASLLEDSITISSNLGMRPLQAHCRRGLDAVYGQNGQTEQARSELSKAIDLYREMELTHWLPETEAALDELEGEA